ncbi:nuclear transport factor 2-like isoform X3 [Prosopis cineraria]|uniref:nuclear transport factor 2-like isoform X3 n=1 Tax=Prosopis cineraria TaxID=364024 RepID=UPI00240F0CEB|nr:nuclear transport factor 2-like isoform X3 [Prosopis cineraria]
MASSEQLAPAQNHPAADIVGNAFVEQYYHMLHESPELVHKFYQDISKLGRPGKNGIMGITTTMQDINEKILSLDEFIAEIISVDAQESYGGGVLVLVTGFMIGKDCKRQKFSQCFFLAPQEKGYFVLNDVFRYVNDNENQHSIDVVEAPATPDNADPSLQQIHVSEQIVPPAEDVNGEEVYNPENGQAPTEEEEAPVPEVMKESAAASPVATAISVRSAPKSLEQHATAASSAPSVSEMNCSNTMVAVPGNNQETEAEGYSIFVKSLPLNATPSLLESEFKKFGPIKRDGIQVRSQRGFCFGFVEFEVASAVQSALEASPIVISGRKAFVEEKRSTNRGNNRPRFSSGRGAGYRIEGGRGRGNHGNGRNYGRGADFIRAESGYRNGSRGGYSSRGNNGYQRVDHTGNNGGGRVNRSGGLAINSMAKATSVPAPA